MSNAPSVPEFVQDDGEGETALIEALLLVEAPAPAQDIEDADPLLRAESRVLRIEIGAVLLRRRRQKAEGRLVDVGRDFVIDAEDFLIFLKRRHDLLDFPGVPAIGRHRRDAVIRRLAEVLSRRREIDVSGVVRVEGDVVRIVPDDRFERIEICGIEFIDRDREPARPRIVGHHVEIIGSRRLGEEADARVDVVREADVVIQRDEIAVRIPNDEDGIEFVDQRRIIRSVIGAAGDFDRIDLARLDLQRIGVDLAEERPQVIRPVAVDEAVSDARADEFGAAESVGDNIGRGLLNDVERIVAREVACTREIGNRDVMRSARRRGVRKQRHPAGAAIVVERNERTAKESPTSPMRGEKRLRASTNISPILRKMVKSTCPTGGGSALTFMSGLSVCRAPNVKRRRAKS